MVAAIGREDTMQKPYLDERRQALEEEYFFKLNRKLLDKLRAAEALVAANAHAVARSPISSRKPESEHDAGPRSQARR